MGEQRRGDFAEAKEEKVGDREKRRAKAPG